MTESVDRQTAVLRLRGADDILILCHKNPDGDTIGCAGALYLALKALGKNAAISSLPSNQKCVLPFATYKIW